MPQVAAAAVPQALLGASKRHTHHASVDNRMLQNGGMLLWGGQLFKFDTVSTREDELDLLIASAAVGDH